MQVLTWRCVWGHASADIDLCYAAALFILFISLLLPFYNTINAIMGSFGNSFTAFVFPSGAYLWVYRTAAARANAPKQPM